MQPRKGLRARKDIRCTYFLWNPGSTSEKPAILIQLAPFPTSKWLCWTKLLHTKDSTQYKHNIHFFILFFFFGWGGGEGQVEGVVGESQMRSWSYKLFLSCSIIQKMNIMLPLCDARWSTNAPIFILFLLIHCLAGNLYSALLTSTRNQPAASPPIYGHCPAPLESLYLFASPPWLHNKTYDFHHALFLATKPWYPPTKWYSSLTT